MVLCQEATSMETSGSIFNQMGNNMKSHDLLYTRENQCVLNEMRQKTDAAILAM